MAFQILRSWSTVLFESAVVVYSISASSNPARELNGVQLSLDFRGGGVGGVPGGRNSPS